MNRYDAFERELTAWFVETAAPRRPEYTTDIVQLTAAVRQRPRWTFLERWLPMSVVTLVPVPARPFPWRTLGMLALLALLFATAVIVYVGSQQRLPPPFGLAANGLVAYTQDGDILTVDPATGARTWITSGNEEDREPRWSLDGTRIAFLRNNAVAPVEKLTETIDLVVVVDLDGNVIAKSRPIPGIDPDAFAWSPDGEAIAVGARGQIHLVDPVEGTVSQSAIGNSDLDFYWRPGTDREILFHGRAIGGSGLFVADVDDPATLKLVVPEGDAEFVRPNGWTADGRRIVYTHHDAVAQRLTVRVLDTTTGSEAVVDAAYAHVSNDGTRLVAIDEAGRPCAASVDAGPCIAIGKNDQAYVGSHAASAFWAPNDEWVVVRVPDGAGHRAVLLDPAGGTNEQPAWLAADAGSWQRRAR
jgi:Tol biopolymer transport system component